MITALIYFTQPQGVKEGITHRERLWQIFNILWIITLLLEAEY